MKKHNYTIKTTWTGNQGQGTSSYKAYSRNHVIDADKKYDTIKVSSDPSFSGDATRYNPEELFLASLSSCHMLWYLHLCSVNNITVVDYVDNATGIMEENKDGSGQFQSVALNPTVTILNQDNKEKAISLHHKANSMCFIARSVAFKVEHNATVIT